MAINLKWWPLRGRKILTREEVLELDKLFSDWELQMATLQDQLTQANATLTQILGLIQSSNATTDAAAIATLTTAVNTMQTTVTAIANKLPIDPTVVATTPAAA